MVKAKVILKEVLEEYHQFARSGKPRCLGG
jgi:hypothetical protein